MAIDINTVIENLNELLTNSVNLTDKYYDLFINPEPMMIDLELYNEDNQLVVVTVPNRAKDRETFGTIIDKVNSLAEVATTGEYEDLKNTPEGTLTIQGNGTTVATFNNSSNTNVTANIQYPTRTSQLVNDAGFITNVTIPAHALKGYLDEGELLTDEEGLTDVTYYAHSTFDSTKFTVVGSPTITDEGIASGFTPNDYISGVPLNATSAITTWDLELTCHIDSTPSSNPYIVWSSLGDGGIRVIITPTDVRIVSVAQVNGDISVDSDIQIKVHYDVTNTLMTLTVYKDGVLLGTNSGTKSNYIDSTLHLGARPEAGTPAFTQGSIDLKTVIVKIDGAVTFRGNQVGVDTYTIANVDVEIPYTLSKTGSKIVDSTYRSRVNLVYNEFGYSPYYTLSDTNYTIPQGELYGYIKKEIQNTVPEVDIPSSRNVGEIVVSTIPLVDAGLHLLDGSLINGSGIYSEFVDYIASIYDASANYFCSESEWQDSVETYGVCGKFVYDSTNNTVRLPKITGFVEGASGVTNLGNLTLAGLPDHTHSYTTVNNGYRATGGDLFYYNATGTLQTGAASASNSIYGRSTTVQPQSIKVLYYIVIATSTKPNIHVDIDEIATDLNDKLNRDCLNYSDTGYSVMAGASMPSGTFINLTLGASGTTYSAPANGYFYVGFTATAVGGWANLYNDGTKMDGSNVTRAANYGSGWWFRVTAFARKGDLVQLTYDSATIDIFRFHYAVGSESEAN